MGLPQVTGQSEPVGDAQSPLPRGASTARRVRVAAGLVLVLAFAMRADCLEALRVAGSLAAGPAGDDPVTLTEGRFRGIIATLPPRGVIGYRPVGPLRVGRNHELEGDDRAIARFVTAQYVLAPRILDLGRTPPLVLRDDLEPVRVLRTGGR